MDGFLVLLSSIAFIGFLFVNSSKKKYLAMAGWISIIGFLFAHLPEYLADNNFLYPLIAIGSLPFLAITIAKLAEENTLVFRLSRAAAIAFLIFAPFAFIESLYEWLISTVISQVLWILSGLGYPAILTDWNMILRNSLRVEIILACTGIQSIAIMLGVTYAVPSSFRQKVAAFLLVVPVIYILNIFRNVFVVIAYTEQWFPYLPEIASNGEFGFESFFWAHNVICEGLALIALILIAYGLFLIIPELGVFADDLLTLYMTEIRQAFDRGKKYAGSRRY